MSWYDDIATASVGVKDGPRLEPGKYRLALDKFREEKIDGSGHYQVTDFLVLGTTTATPVGSTVSYMIKLDGQFESHIKKGKAEVKGLVAALFGYPSDSEEAMSKVNGTVIGQLINTVPCPLRGFCVDAEVWTKPASAKKLAVDPQAKGFNKAKFAPVTPGQVVRHEMPASGQVAPATAPASAPALPGVGTPPPIPGAGAPPPIPPAFPPAGWTRHADNPAYFWKGQLIKTEAELRAMMAAGQA